MIDLHNFVVGFKSTIEVINYFVADKNYCKGLLKLENHFSPASQTIYAYLIKEKFKVTEDFWRLECQNFCKKATTLFPMIFEMSESWLESRLKEINAQAKLNIDSMKGSWIYGGDKKPEYKRIDRLELINILKNRNSKLQDEAILAQQEKISSLTDRYEKGVETKKLKSLKQRDKTYGVNLVDYDWFEGEWKKAEIDLAIEEFEKIVTDKNAFTYKNFPLSPSAVNMQGRNPALLKKDELVLKGSFEADCCLVKDYGLKSIIGELQCF